MATGNITIPEDVFVQVQALAAKQGKTADELAANALKREIAREHIANLQQNRKPSGLTEEEELQIAVDAVHEFRSGR